MLKVVVKNDDELAKQDEQSQYKKHPLGKNVKKALKDYLRDYKGHGDRPFFPSPKNGKQPIGD